MKSIFIAIFLCAISLCSAIETPELSKLAADTSKPSEATKDLETSASDRFFLGAKDYTYGSGYNYGNYLGSSPYYSNNNGYYPSSNSVYRGYQSGLSGILGPRYNGYGAGYGSGYGLGGLGSYGYGSTYGNGVGSYGYGVGGIGYDDSLYGRGYNRWNSLDGNYGSYYSAGYVNRPGLHDYSGLGYGSGYGSGYGNYPYRGIGSYSYNGYPSGYRGYS
ncbi:keratin-associated protein 6-2 isoform X2 [Microplitis demolitor]|uniref:keratin-associated protein 6-2 isoform X2 n=1 Tax=Microplitis demolitor TaxID=69319 RepID=UPI00235B6E61|nr:keratin-associated protein 6-2 isoform X2 [Microplitis demolitor]